jgi:hypothetical protein
VLSYNSGEKIIACVAFAEDDGGRDMLDETKPSIRPSSEAPGTEVGYCRPPMHNRFKPGQSGNPKGRAKGSKNLKTLFNKILNEEVALREGADVRKVSKAEAIMRGLVIGALKGDSRSIGTLFRLAEQAGHFEDVREPITQITRIIVDARAPGAPASFPANRDISSE